MTPTTTLTRSALLAASLVIATTAGADDDRRPWPAPDPVPRVEVTVTRLTAAGPDGARHVLYEDPQGIATRLRKLDALREALQGRPYGPDGAYHTLTATFADRVRITPPDGTIRDTRLSKEGRPQEQRVRGMVLVRDGRMEPLGMTEPPRHRPRRKGDDDRKDDYDDD